MAVTVLSLRLIDEWASFIPAGTFDSFRSDLGLSYRSAALVLAVIAPGGIVGSVFSILADSRSRRAIASGGAVGYAISMFVFATGHSLAILCGAAFLLGVSATAMVDGVEVAIVNLAGETLETTMARVNIGGSIGDLLGPVIVSGVAFMGASWRTAFVVTGFAAAAFAILIAFTPLPPPTEQDRADHNPIRDTFVLLTLPRIWHAGCIGALLVAIDESYLAFVISQIRHTLHESSGVATAFGGGSIVGGLIASIVIARRAAPAPFPARRMRLAAVALFVGTIAIALAPNIIVATTGALIANAAVIAFWLPFQAVVLRMIPGRAGTVSAIVGAVEMIGLAIPPTIGWTIDHRGLRVGLAVYALVPVGLFALANSRLTDGDPPDHSGQALRGSG